MRLLRPIILLACFIAPVAAADYRIAVFRADATPDPGEPNIWVQPVKQVLDPLLVKGIVIDDGQHRNVIAAIDWCGIGSSINVMLRSRIAAAAGTDVTRVALQSVHQHSAPYIDGDGYALLAERQSPALRMSDAYLAKLAKALESAIKDAIAHFESFDSVGVGKAAVQQVASARRILKDGKVLVRYSSTAKSPELAAEPEGDIDKDIRTITIAKGRKPIVRLHYYASHPQTFCCDGRVSADFVGAARERLEREERVPQIYFTGCGGDVTVGKYNTGRESERQELADRLLAGMKRSIGATKFQPVRDVEWRYEDVRLPTRTELPDISKMKQDDLAYRAAIALAFARREIPLPASALELGNVAIIHLPGEPFLAFQRYAQQTGRGKFVAVAGYGDISPGYLCTDEAYRQGGYEPTASNVRTGTEERMKSVLRKLLAADTARR